MALVAEQKNWQIQVDSYSVLLIQSKSQPQLYPIPRTNIACEKSDSFILLVLNSGFYVALIISFLKTYLLNCKIVPLRTDFFRNRNKIPTELRKNVVKRLIILRTSITTFMQQL